MKQAVTAAILLAFGAGTAAAQDEPERKIEELKRGFEKSMKALHEKFQAERERLEKEFRAAQEKLGGRGPRKEEPRKEEPRKEGRPGLEGLIEKLIERVDRLEKRLDRDIPGLKDRGSEMWKEWRDRMPQGGEWNFDFRRGRDFIPPGGREWEKWVPPALKERMERWGKEGVPGNREWGKWMPPDLKERLEKWLKDMPNWKDRDFNFDFRFRPQPGEEEGPRKDNPKKEKEKKREKHDDDSF